MLNNLQKTKIMVLVPHEDDEINLMGGLLPLLVKNGADVIVCFLTNGDYFYKGEVRIKEALKALKVLGVNNKSVYFLGYPDASNLVSSSIYKSTKVVRGKQGCATYGCGEKQDYRQEVSGYHNMYSYDNMKKDLMDIILSLKPEIIFATDIDGHHDHRLCSLVFEECMSYILNQENNNASICV